jgi:DNA-binding MarR family transcriptional regulator
VDVSRFRREINEFHRIDPEMQLTTLLVFLYVAQRGVCTQKDVELSLNLTNGTVSRNVSYWSEMKRYEKPGIGFIKREEDPKDRRYKVLSLTDEGQSFYNKLRKTAFGSRDTTRE